MGVRQNSIYGAVAREIFESRTVRGAENDQTCSARGCLGKYLDERIAVQDNRFDLRMAVSRSFGCEDLKLASGGRFKIRNRAFVDHLLGWR
jgi:hypothetical protein